MDIDIKLDRQSSVSLFGQIAEQIINHINSGVLKAGVHLPAERKFAAQLGVNRSTVINAYSELVARGYVHSHVGRGTIVCDKVADPQMESFRWQELLSGQGDSLINPYNSTLANMISSKSEYHMGSGMPPSNSLPKRQFANICQELLLSEGEELLGYNNPQGIYSLRESVASLMKTRGIDCQPDNVVMLNGSHQGLDIMARILLEPGDCVIIEEPTYLGAIDIFRVYGVKLIGVPVDSEGMIVERLEKILNRIRPKLIYTSPTFANPTGLCMSIPRRKRLLELARKYQVPIFEDDPYGFINFSEKNYPPLKAMDNSGIVVYLNTFSKILAPGLRLGWMVVPQDLVRLITAAKQLGDLHNSNLIQRMVDVYYRKGLLTEHLKKINGDYQVKRDYLLNSLERYAPQGMTWLKPQGGFYVWVTLPPEVPSMRVLEEAMENQVSIVAGPLFYCSDGGYNKIRINFTCATPEELQKGVQILCKVINDIKNKAGRSRRTVKKEPVPLV